MRGGPAGTIRWRLRPERNSSRYVFCTTFQQDPGSKLKDVESHVRSIRRACQRITRQFHIGLRSKAGLLIDVGIGAKGLGERLKSVGSSWSRIGAVVLTHTHADHVDSSTFAELARRGISLHCHEQHRDHLAADNGFLRLEAAGLIRFYDDHPFLATTGLRVEPIAAPRRRPHVRIPDRGIGGTA